MRWEIINHYDLSESDRIRIAELKNQHWPYGVSSQMEWMNKNIGNGDVHLLGDSLSDNKQLLAYATLSKVNVSINGIEHEAVGVGGVCVAKSIQHSGLGKQLLEEAGCYIREQGKMGILLCQDKVLGFYLKCKWNKVAYKTATVSGKEYFYNILILDNNCSCNEIVIDRNF